LCKSIRPEQGENRGGNQRHPSHGCSFLIRPTN
jgi:hypothetical protein